MTETYTRPDSSYCLVSSCETGSRVPPIRLARTRSHGNNTRQGQPLGQSTLPEQGSPAGRHVGSLLASALQRLTHGSTVPTSRTLVALAETLRNHETPAPRECAAAPAAPGRDAPWFHLVVEDVTRSDRDASPLSNSPCELPHVDGFRLPAAEPRGASQVLAQALRGTLQLVGAARPQQSETAEAEPLRHSEHQFQRDRRAFPRRVSGCTVAVCRRSQATQLTAQRLDWLLHSTQLRGQLADVSMNGLAFQLNEAVEQGEELVLRVANRQLDRTIDTTAIVARVSQAQTGHWVIHCRLNKRLSFQEVQQFGQQLLPSAVV